MLIALLAGSLTGALPPDTRLVLVNALDPAAFAGVKGDPAWPVAMLAAVATEDLSHVRHLAVLPLGRGDERLEAALQFALPQAGITVLESADSPAQARDAIASFLAVP